MTDRALPAYSTIRDLAMVDPVSAYAILMGVPRVPFCANIVASFSSLTVDQTPVEASLDTEIYQRTWIEKITYRISMPQAFSGQILKTTWDNQLKQAPNSVSAQIIVQGGPKYALCSEFTPLEGICDVFNSSAMRGWLIYKFQSIQALLVLDAIPGGADAPPLDVVITFTGWSFLDPSVEDIGADVAARRLRRAGFCVPGDLSCSFYEAQAGQAGRFLGGQLIPGVSGVEGAPSEEFAKAMLDVPMGFGHHGKLRDRPVAKVAGRRR